MKKHTTPDQRRAFYQAHQQEETYKKIADRYRVSKECVRYWCRKQRDGGSSESVYHKIVRGPLSNFDELVRYCVLRLRLEHPRWGPSRIRHGLKKRQALRGKELPSDASIGRYLHQWQRFRRKRKKKVVIRRPNPATEVHQRWQLDFKINISLKDGSSVDLHTVRDPVGQACMGAIIYITEQVNTRTRRVPMEQARSTLRQCFDLWNTLPDQVQTDGESTLVTQGNDAFPSTFTLWLKGLGIEHLVIRSGKPTDNAEVERCHRTVNDYAIVGNEKLSVLELQSTLDQAVWDLPSWAEGCAGRPPIQAHPELLLPRHPFRPEHELVLFDLSSVDAFLATFTWSRKVGKTGQICLGGQRNYYSVGRAYAGQHVLVRFDPSDRHFVFYLPDSTQHDTEQLEEIRRCPARDLSVEHLTGLACWPNTLVPQQLALPLPLSQGVNC